jgi:hypothetical protein
MEEQIHNADTNADGGLDSDEFKAATGTEKLSASQETLQVPCSQDVSRLRPLCRGDRRAWRSPRLSVFQGSREHL